MSKLLAIQPQGEVKLMSGLRVAHLALKHRQVCQLILDMCHFLLYYCVEDFNGLF